jgi:hypothetical protein
MRSTTQNCRQPRLLVGLFLFLCVALLPVATPAGACGLDWANVAVVWPNGSLGPHTFPMTTFGGATCPPGLTVTIQVTQPAGSPGSFTFSSPAEDCAAGCVNSPQLFGGAQNLGVVFDPTSAGASPLTITATFSSPFPNLKFEVSDIDFSNFPAAPTAGARRDQVVITSNVGNPTLSFKTGGTHTFSIAGNTATANCTVNAFPTCNPATDTTAAPSDSGTVIADFGALSVTTATITYNEFGTGTDPTGRGVGFLANLTPVELLDFSVE